MIAGAEERGWEIDLGEVATIWRGGCIIRARFLNRITDAYRSNPALVNLMLDPFFKKVVDSQKAWSKRVAKYMFYNEADYKVGYEHIHGKLGF